jgi:hypothetical protein
MNRARAGSGGMPIGRMQGTNGGMPQLDEAVQRGVDQLIAVVDRAVERIGDEQERHLVREGVASIVQQTLYELAEKEAQRQMMLAGRSGAMAIGDGAQAAINTAKQVQNLGFVEFTAGLINGTFDAIVGATVKQMEAYAKLVADLAKTLAQFQSENVSDAQINAHLAQRYPDGQGGTVVRTGFTFTDTAEDTNKGITGKTATEKALEVAFALIAETGNLKDPAKPLTRADFGIPADPIPSTFSLTSFSEAQVKTVRKAIGQSLATSMIEHLREMAREGMARIVVTNGKILTKLTFNVTATEQDLTRTSKYHSDSAGAYVRGSAWAGWGVVSAGGNWNQLNVNTVNTSSFDALTMSTEIIGQVEINFKTETFPPRPDNNG